jgi:hypothetical protein
MNVPFTILEPEVPGGLGEKTRMDTSVHPPVVQSLHFEFEGWLGDELVESFPCFLVTARVAGVLEGKGLSGFLLADVEVTRSEQFQELYPGRVLPRFRWLQIVGVAGSDDFGLSSDHRLVVSKVALQALESCALCQADREPYAVASG